MARSLMFIRIFKLRVRKAGVVSVKVWFQQATGRRRTFTPGYPISMGAKMYARAITYRDSGIGLFENSSPSRSTKTVYEFILGRIREFDNDKPI